MMGGKIRVESQWGQGSTFHFTVRLGLAQEPLHQTGSKDFSLLEGVPVLIVDDNSTNRHILMEMLKNKNMRPAAVDGGQNALAVLQTGETFYPVVLLDAMMPGMDGFELAEAIRHLGGGHKMAMLTSGGQRGDAARCRALGIEVYLTKPIKEADLMTALLTLYSLQLENEPAAALITRHTVRQDHRRLHVLLAEDNPINQRLALRMLEKRGFSVKAVVNGQKALEALADEGFDLCLMDIQMPQMDGFEATAAIRKQEQQSGSHLPIMAMTAYAMKGDEERCLAAGMDGYVSKPIKPEELFKKIEALIPAPTADEAKAGEDSGLLFNAQALLSQVGGDLEILREVVELFLEDAPGQLARVKQAVGAQDAQALQRTAHSLKGALSNFSASKAVEAALQLETMGRTRQMETADLVYAQLEQDVERLKAALVASTERLIV